jgi:hypothetical protein
VSNTYGYVAATFNSYADMANIPRSFSVQNLLVVFFGGHYLCMIFRLLFLWSFVHDGPDEVTIF